MPTTYTHDRFGREVYQALPEELRGIIRENKKLYLIGLHGPDIFFYYHPFEHNRISEFGSSMHHQAAAPFFLDGVRLYQEKPEDGLIAYLMGFCCHFLLDSTCHPYIGRFVEHTGISHAEVETHLDRELMERDGKDPFTYLPAASICPHTFGNRVIRRCFPQFTPGEIEACLKGMKLFTRIPVCRHGWTRGLLLLGMRVLGCYSSMEGRVMRKKKNPGCAASTANLVILYRRALREAPGDLTELYQAILGGAEQLPPRFDRDYE